MRTLHADLTTAQQGSSYTPYVHLRLESRDRSDTKSYANLQANLLSRDNSLQESTIGGWTGAAGLTVIRSDANTESATVNGLPSKYRTLIKSTITTANHAGTLAITFPHAGTYQISAYVLAGSQWKAGIQVRMTITNFTGHTYVQGTTVVPNTSTWQRIDSQLTVVASDLAGNLVIDPTGTNDSGDILYTAYLQVEEAASVGQWYEPLSDSTNRLVSVQQAQGEFGGELEGPGQPFPESCRIILNNSDQALSSLDFRGYRADISWGFSTDSGYRWEIFGPEFVLSQELISQPGYSYLVLHCAGLWEMGNLYFFNINNEKPRGWIKNSVETQTKESTIKFILQELLGGQVIDDDQAISVCFQDDGGTFTNHSVAASYASGSDLGDVGILPITPAVNDAFYFGDINQFDRVSFDINASLSSGSITVTWEYWTSLGTWATLTAIPGTSHQGLSSTGFFIEAFDIPSDWTTSTASIITGGDVAVTVSMYFVRARVTAVSSPVTAAGILASQISMGHDFAYGQLTSEATQGDDYQPSYQTDIGSTLIRVAADLLSFTLMGVIVRPEGFYGLFIDNDQACPDYTYEVGGSHGFYIHTEGQQSIIPNRIKVLSEDPLLTGAPATYSGIANDDDSQADLGIITAQRVDLGATTDDLAATQASRYISQLQRNKVQGQAEVPMNVGQEIYDLVEFIDTRTGRTTEGRVSQMVRLYQSGEYRMHVILGGLTRGIGYAQLPLLNEALLGRQLGNIQSVLDDLRYQAQLREPTTAGIGDPSFIGPMVSRNLQEIQRNRTLDEQSRARFSGSDLFPTPTFDPNLREIPNRVTIRPEYTSDEGYDPSKPTYAEPRPSLPRRLLRGILENARNLYRYQRGP